MGASSLNRKSGRYGSKAGSITAGSRPFTSDPVRTGTHDGSPFEPTSPEAVFGMLAAKGKVRSIEEMNAAILRERERRHARR